MVRRQKHKISAADNQSRFFIRKSGLDCKSWNAEREGKLLEHGEKSKVCEQIFSFGLLFERLMTPNLVLKY